MPYDLLTFGEALVEIMRTGIDQPLDQPGPFIGPYASGAPFIFAVQAARLGARSACIGAVGGDAFGRYLMTAFSQYGLDTSVIATLPEYATGIAFIAYAADGSRDFVFHIRHDAAGQLHKDMLKPALFDGLGCLHITGSSLSISEAAYQLGLRALELAKANRARISFDPNIRPQLIGLEAARERYAPFVNACDVLLPTQEELLALTGAATAEAAAAALISAKPGRTIVVHAGEQGSVVHEDAGGSRRTTVIPAYRVEAVDPTGAGDCFDAGFLVRWLAGDGAVAAARYATACGALACTRQGPMAGAMTKLVVEAFIRDHAT